MNEVEINIGRVVSTLLPQAIAEGLEKCGQLIENEAKRKCPVDTGVLRASINHEVTGKKVVIGTNVEYGPFVHAKTKPFLQESVDENMNECVEVFKGLLDRQVL